MLLAVFDQERPSGVFEDRPAHMQSLRKIHPLLRNRVQPQRIPIAPAEAWRDVR